MIKKTSKHVISRYIDFQFILLFSKEKTTYFVKVIWGI